MKKILIIIILIIILIFGFAVFCRYEYSKNILWISNSETQSNISWDNTSNTLEDNGNNITEGNTTINGGQAAIEPIRSNPAKDKAFVENKYNAFVENSYKVTNSEREKQNNSTVEYVLKEKEQWDSNHYNIPNKNIMAWEKSNTWVDLAWEEGDNINLTNDESYAVNEKPDYDSPIFVNEEYLWDINKEDYSSTISVYEEFLDREYRE